MMYDVRFRFLQDVESGEIEGVLGGQAALHVGSDQDPSKMDIEAIIRKFSKNIL